MAFVCGSARVVFCLGFLRDSREIITAWKGLRTELKPGTLLHGLQGVQGLGLKGSIVLGPVFTAAIPINPYKTPSLRAGPFDSPFLGEYPFPLNPTP